MHNISTAIVSGEKTYPKISPFDASNQYPEFPTCCNNETNNVYDMVRQTLIHLEMDKENMGTEKWSPFREIVNPGNTVVIKPNLITSTVDPNIQNCTTTHPSVIRPIIDYCWKALEGQGRIVVGDCPGAGADFDEIVTRTGLFDMICTLKQRGVNVELKDFRAVRMITENGLYTKEVYNATATDDVHILDMGSESLFADSRYKHVKFYGADHNIRATNRNHHGNIHKYCISKEILQADVVISVPKFKTHRKAGITCCLKNLVGINANKNYLPHLVIGSKNMGGDEMPDIPKNRIPLLRLYNWFREYILTYSWRIFGKPAAILLRIMFKKKITHKLNSDEKTSDKELIDKQKKDVDLVNALYTRITKQPISTGAWSGNETICRMILDLNRIFLCCDKDGNLREKTDRKFFYIVDAVQIGMGNGPMHPDPMDCGIIAAGWNGFSLDTVLLKLFGIDYHVIPLYRIAEKMAWIHYNGDGIQLMNGKPLEVQPESFPRLLAPDNWDYYPAEKG